MIQANLRLVVKIAQDYVGRGIALDDLIGEGNLGLIRAAEEFDPRFGVRFSTYASYWIKQAIRHALINTTAAIRLPAHMVGLLTKWRRAEQALCRQAGRAPSFDEIASFLGLSEAQKVLVARRNRPVSSGWRAASPATPIPFGWMTPWISMIRPIHCWRSRTNATVCCAGWIAWSPASVRSWPCATAWKVNSR